MAQRRPNIREVARAAGVSVGSVSNALRGTPTPRLSEKQRRHILRVCREMRYEPNVHTRRMLRGLANTIAFFFPPTWADVPGAPDAHLDLNFIDCLMGAREEFARQGFDLLMTEVTPEFIDAKRYLEMVRGKQIDGALLWGVLDAERGYVGELLAEDAPLVLVQNRLDDLDCAEISSDDYGGMYAIARRVVEMGHRDIAVVAVVERASTARERSAGVMDALRDRGVRPVHVTPPGEYGYSWGYESAKAILAAAPGTTAILAPNDMAAFGVVDALREAGRRVPADISVTGGDGLRFPGGSLRVESFRVPAHGMGRLAAELLLRRIRGEGAVVSEKLPVIPLPGDTLAPPPARNRKA